MKQHSVETAIQNGLAFLARTQEPDGSFTGESYQDSDKTLIVETVFDTAFILASLAPVVRVHNFPMGMIDRGLAFLRSQERQDGSYNYWDKKSPFASKLAYPNDLDDTALALMARALYEKEFGGEASAKLVRLLTETEISIGGPYNTWICDFINDPRWRDQDLGVNANIAFLLSKLDITLPNLTAFFESCINEESYTSPYYISPIVLIYFIARSYTGELKEKLSHTILNYQINSCDWGNPLLTALAVSSLLRLGNTDMDYANAIEHILEIQKPNGSWAREILYLDPSVLEVRWYHGSSAITTACVLEMLALWHTDSNKKKIQTKPENIYTKEKNLINDTFVKDASLVDSHFGTLASLAVTKITLNPISAKSMVLPFIFKDMLGAKALHIPDDTLIDLGKANLAGWIGYTIIDDIMDGDTDGSLSPFGIWCIRYVCTIYRTLLSKIDYMLVENILTATETALYRERVKALPQELNLETYIFPERSELPTYHKSLGHALPALALLILSGEVQGSELYSATKTFFKHYLAAKQLNDDAHDVAEDIQSRILTQVGHIVLTCLKQKQIILSNPLQEKEIMEVFWYDAFDEVHALIETEIIAAKKILQYIKFENPDYFESLIEGLEHSQWTARTEHDAMIEFLKNY
jgi:hypothetical protein